MECREITTLQEAEAEIPSAVLPIGGLRRGDDGSLTSDALQQIVDGLKSRGIDPTDKETQGKLVRDLSSLLCSVYRQYDFLLRELARRLDTGEAITKSYLGTLRTKNLFLQDILTISRRLQDIQPWDASSEFIEGWQNTGGDKDSKEGDVDTLRKKLKREQEMLESNSLMDLRKHMVIVSAEKNKVASNYLGLYGFLNIVAVGLLIYIAGSSRAA